MFHIFKFHNTEDDDVVFDRFISFAILLASAAAAGGNLASDDDLLCILFTEEARDATLAFERLLRLPTCEVENTDAVAAYAGTTPVVSKMLAFLPAPTCSSGAPISSA